VDATVFSEASPPALKFPPPENFPRDNFSRGKFAHGESLAENSLLMEKSPEQFQSR
jgi:hypothetical protein